LTWEDAWPHSRRLVRKRGASEGDIWPTYGIARSGCRPNLKSGQTPSHANLIIWGEGRKRGAGLSTNPRGNTPATYRGREKALRREKGEYYENKEI